MSFRALFGELVSGTSFPSWYTQLLANSSFEAFFWEHPPLSERTIDLPAEFVLIEAPQLERVAPDAASFEKRFRQHSGDPAVFPNIGGDALLLAPRPRTDHDAFAHLARFVREADESQVRDLWRETGKCVEERLGSEPVWLSTSGLGVSWLHVRIDRDPKYFQYHDYSRRDWGRTAS